MQLKRILVPLNGSAVDLDVIQLAVTLAKPAKAEVTAVHVIEVRWNQPLDAVLDAELDRGEELLAEAAKAAEKLGARVETELLQAREAAAAIVDTARERGSDLIVLGMPYRRRLGRVHVGRTVQNVYTGAHCAVVAYRQEEPE
ncbi:MAG: universal stress protein [Candidatus Limnocylindria bacterium]